MESRWIAVALLLRGAAALAAGSAAIDVVSHDPPGRRFTADFDVLF